VLGNRWEAAGPVLRLLALGGLMQVVYAMETGVMQACGRQRLQFLFAGARASVLVAAFAIGLRWGINGVAAGYTIGEAVMVPFGILAACRATGLPVRAIGTSLRPVAAAGVVMAGAMIALRGWTSLSGFPALVLVPAAGVAVYVALLAWWAHDLKVDSLNLARSLVKGPKS
jgi:O-antigen/teichoic acid export membrane protein